MDTLYSRWAVWSLTSQGALMRREFIGSIEACIRFVEPRQYGSWAILPYDPKNE